MASLTPEQKKEWLKYIKALRIYIKSLKEWVESNGDVSTADDSGSNPPPPPPPPPTNN